jgi:uncharacterized protein YbjT (DUF2867 family)
MPKKAIIVGASGLIGSELLNILLQSSEYQEVVIIVRKEIPVNNPKLVQLIVDFNDLQQWTGAINGHVIFSCLGTTKAQTPDVNEYRKIDHDYPLQIAQMAHQNGVRQYHLVSAIGADVNSGIFYTKLKGETERDIEHVGLPTLHIYQPSFLEGRKQHRRISEDFAGILMKVINPLLIGGLKKYQSIAASTVARAMFKQSLKNNVGTFIHTTDKIKQLA